MARESRHDRNGRSDNSHHLVLLAENQTGYQNLVRLVSMGFLEGFYYKPRIDLELLQAHHQGLIALSSCLKGSVAYSFLQDEPARAQREAEKLREIMGPDRYFLEIQDHGLPEQKKVMPEIIRLSRQMGLPLVATNDCHYLRRDDAEAHDVLLCIQTGKTVQDTVRMKYRTDQFYFKSPEEMYSIFEAVPEALTNTVEIASRCHVEFPLDNPPLYLPTYHVPEGETIDSYFEKKVVEGFQSHLPGLEEMESRGRLRYPLSEYRTRLDYEIRMIKKMGLAGYFLIVWDFIHYAREQKIPVGPGRGSAAGSLVSYCLRITDLDPIQYNLLFERFLNPDRISMPDIDCDFCKRRRSEVMEYVTGKYGRENVGQIITFGAMQAKQVIRDVGRSLNISYSDTSRIAKLAPDSTSDMTLQKAVAEDPQLKEAAKDPAVGKLLEIAVKLEGSSRHSSIHAAGVVIAPRPLMELVPLYKSTKDEIMTQFQMTDLEKIGLLKMDFLALANLTIIDDTIRQIEKQLGLRVDIDKVDLEDRKTYRLFAEGQTNGIFQFESSGMKESLRKVKPTEFEDLIALNALYRPGPMGNIDDYARRKHGLEKVTYNLPEEEAILKETYGILVYQEQVMQLAHAIAGFTLAEADKLRKAMGKKDKALMDILKEKFVAGAKKRGVPENKAQTICQLIERFGSYGFNKSHSTAYAFLAFQTAYLKAHYPVQYMSALLTNAIGTTENKKVVQYITECKRMNIRIAPPDINRSEAFFVAEGEDIRFGLAAIRNVGEAAVHSILEKRPAAGGFRSFTDFCMAMDFRQLNKRVMESLIKSGCFDSLGYPRAQLFESITPVMERCQRKQKARETGQKSLFSSLAPAASPDAAPDEVLDPIPEWTEEQRLGFEKEAIGFYISGHPLNRFNEMLMEISSITIADLKAETSDRDVSIGGILVAVRTSVTKKDNRSMAVCQFEDMTGTIEILVFPSVYEKVSRFITKDQLVLVKGRCEVQEEEGQEPRILASDIQPIEGIKERMAKKMLIRASKESLNAQTADQLSALASSSPGECTLAFEIRLPSDRVLLIDSRVRVRPTPDLIAEIEKKCGGGAVSLHF